MAQDAGGAAPIAGSALERIDLIDVIPGGAPGKNASSGAYSYKPHYTCGSVNKLAARALVIHRILNSPLFRGSVAETSLVSGRLGLPFSTLEKMVIVRRTGSAARMRPVESTAR